jgi:hypothetical protein
MHRHTKTSVAKGRYTKHAFRILLMHIVIPERGYAHKKLGEEVISMWEPVTHWTIGYTRARDFAGTHEDAALSVKTANSTQLKGSLAAAHIRGKRGRTHIKTIVTIGSALAWAVGGDGEDLAEHQAHGPLAVRARAGVVPVVVVPFVVEAAHGVVLALVSSQRTGTVHLISREEQVLHGETLVVGPILPGELPDGVAAGNSNGAGAT